ncbi:5'-methylthioadenosine/S-adenosylhomocysteine nucleosidase [Candidatus Uhrbacteria bacterium]|nr:5'-methylthioadenosine/S-adenosylhomocysteine nucleosidase [Candidatus Uhrbacteria bacterium]
MHPIWNSMPNVAAVIGAMSDELADLHVRCTRKPQQDGFLIVHAGVGKVNAALAVAEARTWNPRCIISIGTAGALAPELDIGDVVVVRHAIQHDVDASPLGFPRGTIPLESVHSWDAHPALVATAERTIRALGFRVITGGVASGERFVTHDAERTWIHTQFGSACIDMETGAIAHACAKLQVPWIGIRIISDRADHRAPASFATALTSAANAIARIVPPFIAALDHT